MRYSILAAALAVFSVALIEPVGMGMAQAASPAQIDTARAKGLAWLYQTHKGDGSWGAKDALKVQSTATVLEAFRNNGIQSGQAYGAGVAWLANAEAPSIDAASRKIMALYQAGLDTSKLAQALIDSRPATNRKSWGSYFQYALTIPDTALGQAALRQSAYKYAATAAERNELGTSIYCDVLPAQRADGGWSFTLSPSGFPASLAESAVVSTSIVLLELKAAQMATGWDVNTCGSAYSLTTAINAAVAYLDTQRHADNGIGAKNISTSLETALAYLAIKAVNPNHAALIPAQDYLLIGAGKPGTDGSWQGDPFVTALALKTLPAATLPDTDKDGIPDAVEVALNRGTSTTVADGRDLPPGNGNAQPGVSTALFATTAYLNVPYSLGLSGTSPFAVVSGQLPSGLSLAGTGLLSGTPAQLGTYNFVYSSAGGQTVAAVSVVLPGTPGDLNGDGSIDVADLALLKRRVLGLISLTPAQAALADLSPAGSPDGVLDMADVQRLMQLALGLE